MTFVVELITLLLGLYFALGLIFAGPFVLKGVERVDPAAKGAKWRFKVLLIPGVMAFWPLLLKRWVSGTQLPVETNEHRRQAGIQEGAPQ